MSEISGLSVKPENDFSKFFGDSELVTKFPDLKLPPPTFVAHQGSILSFELAVIVTRLMGSVRYLFCSGDTGRLLLPSK